jgi:hypothetical protein
MTPCGNGRHDDPSPVEFRCEPDQELVAARQLPKIERDDIAPPVVAQHTVHRRGDVGQQVIDIRRRARLMVLDEGSWRHLRAIRGPLSRFAGFSGTNLAKVAAAVGGDGRPNVLRLDDIQPKVNVPKVAPQIPRLRIGLRGSRRVTAKVK